MRYSGNDPGAEIPLRGRGEGQHLAGGFTLLEVAVSIAMFTLLFIATWQMLSVSAESLHGNHVAAELDSTVHRVYSRIREELKESGTDENGVDHMGPASLGAFGVAETHPFAPPAPDPAPAAGTITFRMRVDFTGDPAVDWSTPITYSLKDSPGEGGAKASNGVDDDNDGVIDERQLARTQDGETIVLADRITGLTFTRAFGEYAVRLQITASRAVTRDMQVMSRTLDAVVALRNKG